MKTLTQTKVIALNKVMAYKNPALVARLQEKLNLSKEDAETLFADTKRFLYLCATNKHHLIPPTMVDEGWHNFILFTKDYQKFCHRFLGRFIHHAPKDVTKQSRGRNEQILVTKEVIAASFPGKLSRFWASTSAICSGECEAGEG